MNQIISSNLQLKAAYESAHSLMPLSGLSEEFLSDLFNHVNVQTVTGGQVIFDVGHVDQQHIYLLHGTVILTNRKNQVTVVDGAETSLPLEHEQPRQSEAMAETDCTILRVDSDYLDRMLCWSQAAQYLMSELSLERERDADMEWIQTLLSSNLFFKVPPINVEQIVDKLTSREVNKGDVILSQGELGHQCFFIKEGEAEVSRLDGTTGIKTKIADITVGRCFGEDALVNDTARNASITMKTDGILMVLEKNDFLLLRKEPMVDEVTDEHAADLLQSPVYIDVRTEAEYQREHIAFSANIPLGLLSMKKRLLNQASPYIFYCDTGRRSRAAAYLLAKQGYNTQALKGGFIQAGIREHLVQEAGYILRDGALVASKEPL